MELAMNFVRYCWTMWKFFHADCAANGLSSIQTILVILKSWMRLSGAVRRVVRNRSSSEGKFPCPESGGLAVDFKHALIQKVVVHRYSCQHRFIPEIAQRHATFQCPFCWGHGAFGFLIVIENDPGVLILPMDIMPE